MASSDLGAWFTCLVLAAGIAPAQVFIVDAAGGGGAHFTDLPTAVAAVPDGSTLRVRAGSYAGFTLAGKGLSIVGEGNVTIAEPQPIRIAQIGAGQRVLLKGLVFGGGLASTDVELADSSGPIIVESCSMQPGFFYVLAGRFRVFRCANVWFHDCALAEIAGIPWDMQPRIELVDSVAQVSRCNIVGYSGPGPILGTCDGSNGGTSLTALRSRVVVVASTLRGGVGSRGRHRYGGLGGCFRASWDGGDGVELDSSTLIALDSEIAGRDGHDEFRDVNGLVPASNGGDALLMQQFSRASAMGTSLLPGRGGSPTGTNGLPVRLDGSCTFEARPAARSPAGHVAGDQAIGRTIEFVARGGPGHPLVLVFSYRADLLPLEPLAFGSLLASPALSVGPFALSATGDFRAPFLLPATWPLGETYFGQFVSLEPGPNTVWLGNGFPLHVNH